MATSRSPAIVVLRWAKKSLVLLLASVWALALAGPAAADTITLSAGTISQIILSTGDVFSDATYNYGIDRVYIMPVVSGGTVTFDSGSASGASLGSYLALGSSSGYYKFDGSGGDPLNLIMDSLNPVTNFPIALTSGGQTIGKVDPSAYFTVNFTVAGGTYLNQFYFLVDGYQFLGTDAGASYASNFWSFTENAGSPGSPGGQGFAHNDNLGYLAPIPLPSSLLLLGSGLLGLLGFGRRKLFSR